MQLGVSHCMFVTVSTAPKEKADSKMSKNKKKKLKKKMKKQQQLLEQQRLQLEEMVSGQHGLFFFCHCISFLRIFSCIKHCFN